VGARRDARRNESARRADSFTPRNWRGGCDARLHDVRPRPSLPPLGPFTARMNENASAYGEYRTRLCTMPRSELSRCRGAPPFSSHNELSQLAGGNPENGANLSRTRGTTVVRAKEKPTRGEERRKPDTRYLLVFEMRANFPRQGAALILSRARTINRTSAEENGFPFNGEGKEGKGGEEAASSGHEQDLHIRCQPVRPACNKPQGHSHRPADR